MKLRPHPSGGEGFTLIELLTAIAVISTLLAVVVPALKNAKQTARQVVCASQMKQWALACMAYSGDNDNAVPPYADTCDRTNGGHALDIETFWYNRLALYLTRESQGSWGMDRAVRRCPSARANWGDQAVWVGVYYGHSDPERAPFIFLNEWDGSKLTRVSSPFITTTIKSPANYLMLLDVRRDRVHNTVRWRWDTDFSNDGMNDSNSGVLASSTLGPYNSAQPRIHRGGCNVALFDGHVEWIHYDAFWQIAPDGYPVHPYWFNNNRP